MLPIREMSQRIVEKGTLAPVIPSVLASDNETNTGTRLSSSRKGPGTWNAVAGPGRHLQVAGAEEFIQKLRCKMGRQVAALLQGCLLFAQNQTNCSSLKHIL